MRILLIHNYYQYQGGEETYIKSLVILLRKNGHKVKLYTKNSKTIKSFWDKIKVAVGMFWNRKVEKELRLIIEEFKPDITQIQNIFPLITPTAYYVCKKFRVPIIQRVSNYRFMCPKASLFRNNKICELCVGKRFFYPAIYYGCYQNSKLASLIFSLSFFFHRYILKSFDKIDHYIFPSKFIRNYYVRNAQIDPSKTTVINSFVLKNKKASVSKRRGNYFLYVGRLSEEKGIISLLELFKDLKNQRLIIIGDGPIHKQVEQYKIYSNIIFKGFLPKNQVFVYMQKAIALIIPSLWYDVLPNVLLEALSNGAPVIVPKNGVFKDIIKTNKTGQIYVYSSQNELKKLITIMKTKKTHQKKFYSNPTPYNKDFHYQRLIKVYNHELPQ